ncbi:MAG: hypothetical protein V7L29_09980 [Nostoc sp.]|uniref:hypothetical protein n=1 Tax=Nostoc sp. TaxID=1180 RepID=UPI002FF5F0F4
MEKPIAQLKAFSSPYSPLGILRQALGSHEWEKGSHCVAYFPLVVASGVKRCSRPLGLLRHALASLFV